ncbi:MAG TPA: hypothetical protein VNC16_11080 [Solirubrobacterales bacterium]|nr:hypothetical protein [Solirubrobacterales bacterium]
MNDQSCTDKHLDNLDKKIDAGLAAAAKRVDEVLGLLQREIREHVTGVHARITDNRDWAHRRMDGLEADIRELRASSEN